MNNNKAETEKKLIEAGDESVEEAKEMDNAQIVELTTKLNGVILCQAELQNNFERVYLSVFERMAEFQALGGNDMLEVLGDVGS